MVEVVNAGDESRFTWIHYAGGIDNLDVSIPLALGFIGSDEWELLALRERHRVAWIEGSEFSTVALVEVLMKIEAWSHGGPYVGGSEEYKTGGKYDRRHDSLRRKVQRKLDSMSDDPTLLERTSPGHWRVKSEEYKKYCTIRFELSKQMDEGWGTEGRYEGIWKMRTEPSVAHYQMAMHHDARVDARAVRRPDDEKTDAQLIADRIERSDRFQDNLNKQSSVKMEELIEQVQMTNKKRNRSSSQLYRSFLAKRHRESRNAAHFSWERQLNHRFRRLTVGNRVAGPEIWHLDLDSGGETTKDEPGEREWPLKSIPEPARDEEGRFEIGSKKMKWKVHVSILEIMTKVGEDRNLENRPWISRGDISDALLESGEEKTEGRISQVLGDLVGLGIIEKKSHKDDGRIKLYRVKDGALLRKQKNKYDSEDKRDEELAAFMLRLDAEKEEERMRMNVALAEINAEIQSIG